MKKIDNFIIIQDAFSSMGEKYSGRKKLTLAKDILDHMNQTIPEFDYTCGLRTFGEPFWSFGKGTSLIYGLKRYTNSELGQAIKPIEYAGISPLGLGIDGAAEDLKGTGGKIAVIILSDGMETGNDSLASAKIIKKYYGDRLCIYTILIGNNASGKRLLEQIAKISGCGFAVNADQIYSSEGMAGFVERVFLTRKAGAPLDSDGDGVYDHLDRCPNTPRGVRVDTKGCPLDTDGDGVYDYLDECPGTPRGVKVDNRGCWVLKGVFFDTATGSIKPQSFPVLDEVVVLKRNPGLKA